MKFIVFLLIVAISVGGYAANACAFGQVGEVRSQIRTSGATAGDIPSCHEGLAQSEKGNSQKALSKNLSAHVCCAPYLIPVVAVFNISSSVLKVEKPTVDAVKHGEFVYPPFRPPSA
jgi:hypothetical protein